ncbi:MAG: hypothetical protein D6782_12380, partial [Alphaproteobacteria bacterium]
MGAAWVNASVFAEWRGIFAIHGLVSDALAARRSRAEIGTALPDVEVIDLAIFVRLLERAARASDQAGLAWTAGQSANYATRGKVGQAVLGARTLGAALRRLSDFYPLVQDATSLKLEIEEDWASLNYRILDPEIWPRHEDAIYSLGIYARLIKAAAPEAWNQIDITVEADGIGRTAIQHIGMDDMAEVRAHHMVLRFHGDVDLVPRFRR